MFATHCPKAGDKLAKVVRLKESGAFEPGNGEYSGLAHLDKDAMLVYSGKFESMDGPVEIKDEDIEKLASNHNTMLSKLSRLATGEHHPKNNPPVQLDHSTSARDTVGRLRGDLRVGEYEKDGVKLKALFGKPRILGKENVEKVEDGRWVHLSGGFDLENHSVSELTITPFPAAADAAMLSRRRLSDVKLDTWNYGGWRCEMYKTEDSGYYAIARKGGKTLECNIEAKKADVREDIETLIDHHDPDEGGPGLRGGNKSTKLSSGEDTVGYKEIKEKADLYAKCKKHLTEFKKLSDEDADKHLEAAKDEELTAMGADEDGRQKSLADEKVAADKKAADEKESELKRMANLSGQKTKMIELSKGLKAANGKVQLAAAKAGIMSRLSRLQAETKVTPAEVKAMNIDELAGKSEEVIKEVLASYEKRQPVIDVGMFGSTKALTAVQLRSKVKSLGAEFDELKTRLAMPLKRPDALKRLSELGLTESDLEKGVSVQQDKPVPGHEDVDMEAAYGTLKKLWGEGKEEDAKAHFKRHFGGAPQPEVAGPDLTAEMSALAADVKTMQAGFDEIVKLAAPVFGVTAEELA